MGEKMMKSGLHGERKMWKAFKSNPTVIIKLRLKPLPQQNVYNALQ